MGIIKRSRSADHPDKAAVAQIQAKVQYAESMVDHYTQELARYTNPQYPNYVSGRRSCVSQIAHWEQNLREYKQELNSLLS